MAADDGRAPDRWDALSELEQDCLSQFLQQLSHLRPHLVQCYDREGFPRTNNEMERSIRGLKTQYRRISGRKNWNSYLLRYGRCVAYSDWWEQDASSAATTCRAGLPGSIASAGERFDARPQSRNVSN